MISKLVTAPRRRDSDTQKYCKCVPKMSEKNSTAIISLVVKNKQNY